MLFTSWGSFIGSVKMTSNRPPTGAAGWSASALTHQGWVKYCGSSGSHSSLLPPPAPPPSQRWTNLWVTMTLVEAATGRFSVRNDSRCLCSTWATWDKRVSLVSPSETETTFSSSVSVATPPTSSSLPEKQFSVRTGYMSTALIISLQVVSLVAPLVPKLRHGQTMVWGPSFEFEEIIFIGNKQQNRCISSFFSLFQE